MEAPMSIIIDLPPELEQRLREEADRDGTDPGTYLVRIVARQLGPPASAPAPAALGADEAALLQQINLGLTAETWERYHQLIERRCAETLSEQEQQELVGISDQIEAANARRIAHLAALARLRGTTVRALMDELGIPPDSYA
jgi:hypothetical protein